MKLSHLRFSRDLRRGLALIIVITTISLISILVVAIFSITRTEFKATQGFVFARSAKQLGDIGTAIVQAEISNAHNTSTAPIERRIHATQPGMVRVYSATGIFVRAHKLYSSSQMTVTGTENALFTPVHQIPQDWNSDTNKARFVDLNDPVIRPSRLPGAYALYFPIIDPRAAAPAAAADDPAPVEGFSYSKQTAQVGNNASISYQEVVTPSDVSGGAGVNQLRLPMPVEWLYVLQDGTTGTLNESNEFISSAPDSEATAQNPIIGRIAFWTDDECCKVNINTAAEPTFFAPPFFYHQRDYAWANYPPASGEYQRYPGHPATVALSAVLAPGLTLDPLKAGVNRNAIVETKEQIYELAPKIAKGGSKAGTLTFVTDEMSAARGEETTLSTISDAAAARSERLYASVDDLIFKEGPYENNLRPASLYNLPDGGGKRMFDRETIERSRFFLSAHSRAPEMTIHGLPRITMWPVADEKLGSTRRTSFDNMLALCSTLRPGTSGAAIKHSYIFRRAQAHHPTHDVTGTSSQFGSSDGLRRNSLLLDYLYAQMNGLNFPGTSSAGAPTTLFSGKYGQSNVAQLAVQFFDYIRCTNLYDGVLARENNGIDGQSPTGTALYMLNDQMEGSYFTYTNHRVSRKANDSLQNSEYRGSDLLSNRSKVFPGHGTVTPAVWAKGGTSYRGLGRMLTLSEVGFQFICTADGQNDRFAVTVDGVESGGGSAPRSDPTLARRVRRDSNSGEPLRPGKPYQKDQDHQRYYSNFPPLFPLPGESEVPGDLYGCKPNEGSSSLKHPVNHPGYDPRNWNLTLANRTPLKEDEKRIQAMILFETFCPMLGWTKMYPEFALELDKDFIAQIKVKDATGASVPLFDTTSLDLVVKSNNNLYESGQTTYSLGGHAGPSQVAGNRDARPISGSGDVRMIADPNFGLGNTAGHNGLTRYGFNSNFITVKRKDALELTFGRSELVINLYDSHRFKELSLAPIQVIRINFTAEANTTQFSLPMPALAFSMQRGNIAFHPNELQETYSTDNEGRLQYWRALPAPHWWSLNSEGCLDRLRGQVNPAYTGSPPEPLWAQAPAPPPGGEEQNVFRQTFRGRLDTGAQHFGHEAVHGGAQGVPIIPRETVGQTTDVDLGIPWSGTDVIRTMVPAVGDYRLIAARYDVPASMWMMHPVWKKEMNNGTSALKTIHSFTSHMSGSEPGVVLEPSGLSNQLTTDQQLIAGLAYIDQADNNRNFLNRRPDLPPDAGWGRVANSFGDFDNGIANSRDGPWANKPDEGNFFMGDFTRYNQKRRYRSGYFFDPWNNSEDWRSGIYMTPNRIVTSPVMFGSLPSAVWDGSNVPASANPLQSSNLSYTEGRPWQTLLFRPYSRAHSTLSKANHPGAINPRDHYLLDMFTMPVVEPYAISEPLSTAGKINLNYQIMPFTNIRRATALHALMKGEFITTIPKNADAHRAKSFYSSSNRFTEAQRQSIWGAKGDLMWDETTSPDKKFWHRPINVGVTLGQFDQKFNMAASATIHSANYRGLFRSPSQICEMHLVPDVTHGSANGKTATASDGGENIQGVSVLTSSSTGAQMEAAMSTFWQNHSPTGDNTRERPYSNLYARVTTRSNTFRVHVRAQVIRKARSVGANKFDPTKDAIVSEYRGSSLIERFIDPTDTSVPIPDYGASSDPLNQTPLEAFYQFRTLESKRFSP